MRVRAGIKVKVPDFEMFSSAIEGLIVGLEKVPNEGVKIMVNGKERTQTDANGKYLIEYEKPETLLIEAVSDRNIYDSIKIKVD